MTKNSTYNEDSANYYNHNISEIQTEVAQNKLWISKALNESDELIFVNGALYKNFAVFTNRKGCGWAGGLTEFVRLNSDLVSKDDSVLLVSLSFGRARKLIHADGDTWALVKEPEDYI